MTMQIQDAMELIKDDMRRITDGFGAFLDSDVLLIKKVSAYIMANGGKRFRPMLMLLCARLFDSKDRRLTSLAAVVEFIHTATLLHDDVVDNAALRRGRASANSVWGDGASILVGDYLLAKSFALAVAEGNLRILDVLSKTTTRMAEGEVLQLLRQSDIETTEEQYLEVVSNKTAVLIQAACRISAIVGAAGREEEDALADYGLNMGIAYQLADDCLDYTSNDACLGKSIGNDLREGKVTMPLIEAYRNAAPGEKKIIREAIEDDALRDGSLEEVISIVKRYGGIGYTLEKAKGYVAAAKKRLEVFPPDSNRAALLAVADYVVERTS